MSIYKVPSNDEVGRRLRLLRQLRGLTQRSLAEHLHVVPTVVGNWENGTEIRREYWQQLCEILWVKPSDLFL